RNPSSRTVLSRLRPNTALEPTPLRVERDHADFEGRVPLERLSRSTRRRSSAAGRWAAHQRPSNPGCSELERTSEFSIRTYRMLTCQVPIMRRQPAMDAPHSIEAIVTQIEH